MKSIALLLALCAVGASAQGWMSSRPRKLRTVRRNRRLTFSPYGPTPIRPPFMDEDIGGGKIYGEYNKGPVKVGGEWNFDEDANERVGWRGAAIKYGPQAINAVRTWGPVVKHCVGSICGFDESEDIGGGKIYGEYNKGPVKVGGEWDFDEDLGEESIGSINWMTGCDRNKCPCGCEPCQSGLCRCYSWCRSRL